MIGNAKVLTLITARGGSKGLPRKNVLPLGGKPLIAWSIEAAKGSAYVDRLILSSDDPEIMSVAAAWGCEVPFVRPAELATDQAGSLDVVRHAISQLSEAYDYIVLLQPTSPLRTSADIDDCIKLCHARAATTCVTVCAVDKTPYWMFKIDAAAKLIPLFPASDMPQSRQNAPDVFLLNGAVYVARTDHIMSGGAFVAVDTVAHVMSRSRSIDIDTREDLEALQTKVSS
jgi:CMP-N,N'-diacetyllegionaminic acid synthase